MRKLITLETFNRSNKELSDYLRTIYEKSFPDAERREFATVLEMIDAAPEFKPNVILYCQKPVGLLFYWQLDNFCFLEHFAIDKACRSLGIGKYALQSLTNTAGCPIVLEVEEPVDHDSKRRIQFYERQGFKLWNNIEYLQPPYTPGLDPLNFKLMTYGDINLDQDFNQVRNQIYINVYDTLPNSL